MLKDKVIFIAGGAGLIAKGFIQEVHKQGAKVVIADVNLDKAKEIATKTPNSYGIFLDITSKDSLQGCIKKASDKFGKIDALVNCAYPRSKNWGKKDFFELEYDELSQNLSMQLGGSILLTQEFARFFKVQGYGNIVLLSSIMGVYAPKFENYKNTSMISPVEYSVIKAGIIHLARHLAKFLKNTNIRINTIAPGGILDNQPESFLKAYRNCCVSKGMLDFEDLNGTLIYLLSDMSKFVTGQTLIVDDGWGL